MNLQRISVLTLSNIKRTLREPSSLFLVLMFPVAMTILFGTAFGAIGSSSNYTIGVVDLNAQGSDHHWSQDLIENLSATKILVIQDYKDDISAQDQLSQGKLAAVIIIPKDFGQSCQSYIQYGNKSSGWTNSTIIMHLDPGSIVSVQAVPPMVQQIISSTVYGKSVVQGPISIGSDQVTNVSHLTNFDHMAPGIFTFAAVFMTMIVAQSFTLDREKGLLRRISTTPTTAGEFIMSHVLSNMVLAILQLFIVFALVMSLGFHSASTNEGLLLAFGLVITFSLCTVGFGLITASIAKTPGQATMIAFAFIMPQMFLGTFMGSNMSSTAQAAGGALPAFYVTDGLTTILLRGGSFASVSLLLDIFVVIASSMAALIIGVVLFRRYGNR